MSEPATVVGDLTGFSLLECDSLDEAIRHAAAIPAARLGSERRRVLATVIRLTGDLALAEDAVQDADISALATWRRLGVPPVPPVPPRRPRRPTHPLQRRRSGWGGCSSN